MAHYDKESGQIILSVEDEEMLKEANQKLQNKSTPIADSIIRTIHGTNAY